MNTIWGEGDDGNDGEAKMHLVIRRLPYGYSVKYMPEKIFPSSFGGDFLNYEGEGELNLEFGCSKKVECAGFCDVKHAVCRHQQ